MVQGRSDRSWEEASSICKDNWELAPSNLISEKQWQQFAEETCTLNEFAWLGDKIECKSTFYSNIEILYQGSFVTCKHSSLRLNHF